MKRRLKWAVAVAIVLVLGLGLRAWLTPSDNQTAPTVVAVEHVDEFTEAVQGLGQIRAITEHFLSVRNGGLLTEKLVQPGSSVKAGQVVAAVDATVNKSKLETALSQFQLAQNDYARIRRLFNAQSATAQELDEARNKLNVNRAELKRARQDLEDSLVRSPADGVLSFFAFNQGDFIPNGSRVAVVEDRSQLQVLAKLPYEDVQRLPTEMMADLQLYDLTSRKVVGETEAVKVKINLVNIASNYDAASRDVRFVFAPTLNKLGVSDPVQISLVLQRVEEPALLPPELVVTHNNERGVILVDDQNRFQFQKINQAGEQQGRVVALGLARGARVMDPSGQPWQEMIGLTTAAGPAGDDRQQ